MPQSNDTALVESLLYLESVPVDLAALSRITGLTRQELLDSLEAIKLEYAKSCHGIELAEVAGGYCFAPKKEYWARLKHRFAKGSEKKLSRAAIETLAIVAYSQPITKAEIESMRGVSADGMLRHLLDHKFVRTTGKKDVPGRPVQYGTTREFLMRFSLNSISDLPKLDDLEQERFEPYER